LASMSRGSVHHYYLRKGTLSVLKDRYWGQGLLVEALAYVVSQYHCVVLFIHGKDADKESSPLMLFGLGVANVCGSFFSAYPTTGSFSRSAVNHESGAKTGLSGIIMGVIVVCALQFLTPLFTDIPQILKNTFDIKIDTYFLGQCTLAAIVISAVLGLIDYEEAIFLWRVDKRDFLQWVTTSITTLFLGIEIGVLVGVGISLAFVIHESANPHIAVLGRLPGTTVYRNIKQYPEAYIYHGIVIVRIDAPIYFANISYIKDRLREYEARSDGTAKHGVQVEKIFYVVIEMAPVTYIDSSAAEALKELYQEYKARNIQMAISNPNQEILSTLAKSGVVELIGKEWYFVRVHDAVQVCLSHLQGNVDRFNYSSEEPEQDISRKQSNSSLSKTLFRRKDFEDASMERQPLITERTED
ncbi:hypothetical protein KI387_019488, partial [Taxus chinensis]